ncbi:hypothetical protein [Micromonospora sp. RP3T]|uniref:hypothetical protein n=1 Tax=Micromonospora sp. RP3T TaxID=2135446 RepID=UPI003D70844D
MTDNDFDPWGSASRTPAPTPAASGDVDPAADPSGYLADVLARSFRPGWFDSIARTWAPIAVGSVLAWINTNWNVTVPAGASSTFVIVTAAVTIAAYYALGRLLERRFPRAGRWLLALGFTRARPTYAQPAAAAQVEAAARTTPPAF